MGTAKYKPRNTSRRPFKVRFIEKVSIRSQRECWPWLGFIKQNGYGAFRKSSTEETSSAHCVAWEIAFGKIPLGKHVLHKCDTRSCVNPSHLFTGTPSDNMRDMVKKGRHGGSRIAKRKLTAEQVRTIRAIKPGEVGEYARKFFVSPGLIAEIRRGCSAYDRGRDPHMLLESELKEIRDGGVLLASVRAKHSAAAVARRYGITTITVHRIRAGRDI